ncbi:hypothetical protein BP5796_04509 [Coleophoma crateriformis]|uniref:Nephrocystin 3-like N-terminal domain-containing protein n=1 Tax=Coleophoma crateriformis TaxID=565419 RepID=A0A3D8SB61_9HELO|nr:hypothetical protein BP5796_04509 [Coleophoma crateriformis]
MDPFSVTGTLIAVIQITTSIVSICYDYRQGAKSASKDIVLITAELDNLKSVLETLLRLLEQTQSQDSSQLSTLAILSRDDGPLLVCQTELELLRERLEPEVGWRKIRSSLVWPLKEKDVTKTLATFERLKSTMLLALSADQAILMLNTENQIGYLSQHVHQQNSDLNRQRIISWLAAPDPSINHNAARKKHQPSTGAWLLTSKAYEHWLQGYRSFLWLYGIPGSGKTILCSTVIEQLTLYSRQQLGTTLLYFYFDFNDIEKRDLKSFLNSLLLQLYEGSSEANAVLQQLYQNFNKSQAASTGELAKALHQSLDMLSSVYIVVDALDESSELDEVLGLFQEMRDWRASGLHILVTSRQLSTIQDSLGDLVSDQMNIQDSQTNHDIRLFIDERLAHDRSLAKWPQDIRKQIRQKLVNEAKGMFQWVKCQIDMLRRCVSIAALRKAMNTLPKSLDETYERILFLIDEDHQTDVRKTLKTLTVFMTELKFAHISEILAVDLESSPPHFDIDARLIDPRNILEMCSSLLTTAMAETTAVSQGEFTLQLAHASVSDYLTQPRAGAYHFTQDNAHEFMAQTCVAYLMNPVFTARERPARVWYPEYPFLKYSLASWPLHIKSIETTLSTQTQELLLSFFASQNFTFWVSSLIPGSSREKLLASNPLYYAASYGLLQVVELLLSQSPKPDVNAKGGRVQATALHAASYRGHVAVVRLLLEAGAEADTCNELGESALGWASLNRFWDVRVLLMEYGAREETRQSNRPGR